MSIILKDLYGRKYGSVHEFGSADSVDPDYFTSKLQSLKGNWKHICPGFFPWFETKRKQPFAESVIKSAREGTSIAGLFYQNDIESMHFMEKISQCYKKASVVELINSLRAIVTRQQTEEIRALYGAGSYCLQSEFKKFLVDSAKWHTRWSEQQRKGHVSTFREYSPTISDSYTMPHNVGRKPGFQQRTRPTEPSVLIDRITDDNQIAPIGSYIRFADPSEKPPKLFELHLRTNLPCSVIAVKKYFQNKKGC